MKPQTAIIVMFLVFLCSACASTGRNVLLDVDEANIFKKYAREFNESNKSDGIELSHRSESSMLFAPSFSPILFGDKEYGMILWVKFYNDHDFDGVLHVDEKYASICAGALRLSKEGDEHYFSLQSLGGINLKEISPRWYLVSRRME